MSEPWEELPQELRIRAVVAFLNWARVQQNPFRPFSETIGGRRFTPHNLVTQPTPLAFEEELEVGSGAFGLRLARLSLSMSLVRLPMSLVRAIGPPPLSTRHTHSRAWSHVLNLVAVSSMYAEAETWRMLNDIDPLVQTDRTV